MWNIPKPQIPANWLPFEPVTILYEYDFPLIFTLRGKGRKHLAFFCGQDGESVRFLVVPFSDELERRLVSGDINLRDALTRPQMWVFDLDQSWEPVRCWRVVERDLPKGLLPEPGVMLWASQTPVISDATIRSGAGSKVFSMSFPPRLTCAGV